MTVRQAAVTSVAAVAIAGVVQFTVGARAEGPLMKSAVFQWDALQVKATDIGARRDVVRAPTATLDELESHITTLNAGQSPHPPHQHPNEELIILKEGEVEAYVNGQWVAVRTGGMMFFASNQPHTVRNVSSGAATYYVVNWSSPGMLKNRTNAQ